MLESKLSPEIITDEHCYFFTMLSDRFEPLNKRWQEGLEKRFNKSFRPIAVLPFRHNASFEEENYIILNEQLQQTHNDMGRTDVINLIYPEELNKQFSNSPEIAKLIDALIAKQGTVYILGFTSVWLDIKNPNVVVLGPESTVASKYDDKAEHIKTFEKLGFHTNKNAVYSDFRALRDNPPEYPFFLSATFSSGGIESTTIYTPRDLEIYYSRLRPLNQAEPFIASRLITDIVLAPNTNALVSGLNQTTMVCIADQILRHNLYMGNIYPTQAPQKHLKQMQEMTIKVGNYLSQQGFRGLFGLDFLITKAGHCYPTDLNPRRQGGYYCNVMASPFDIIDLELRVIFNEPLPSFGYDDFKASYCWAHSKLSPYFHNIKITNELNVGNPSQPFQSIGAMHSAIYYPKAHTLLLGNPGFYLITGTNYEKIKQKLSKDTEKIISTHYELYEGQG